MFHKLTQLIKEYQHSNPNRTFTEYDKIIREDRESLERSLWKFIAGEADRKQLREILGLESEKKEGCQHLTHKHQGVKYTHHWSNNCPNKEEPKGSGEKVGSQYCVHNTWSHIGWDGANYCKFCGAPHLARPNQMGLREKLAEKLRGDSDFQLSTGEFEELADIAIATIKEHEGE